MTSLASQCTTNASDALGKTLKHYNYDLFQSPFGWIGLLGSEKGLRRLSLKPKFQEALEALGPELDQSIKDPSGFTDVRRHLNKIFHGDAKVPADIKLDMSDAPPFFRSVWQACSRIPAGETRSYSWLAESAGNPRAARAAGQAMAKNPFPLIIPCHRVITMDGGLRGYAGGGPWIKKELLDLERTSKISKKHQ